MIVMWQVRLRMRVARPRARGRQRLSVGPSSAKQADTKSSSGSWSSLLLALATAEARHLADDAGDVALDELEDLVGVVDVLAADEVEDLAGLVGRDAHVARPGRGCRGARWSCGSSRPCGSHGRPRSACRRWPSSAPPSRYRLERAAIGSHSVWRTAGVLAGRLQNSRQNGGRGFLIFVADPRPVRLCAI